MDLATAQEGVAATVRERPFPRIDISRIGLDRQGYVWIINPAAGTTTPAGGHQQDTDDGRAEERTTHE
jgi:hypothetical protein